ncbi:hypothetical protein ES707_02337 [subsurface metagenome]
MKKKRKENKTGIIKELEEVEELEKAYFLEQKPRLLFGIEQALTLLILSEIKLLKSGLNKKEAKIINKLEHSLKKGIESIKSLRSESSNYNMELNELKTIEFIDLSTGKEVSKDVEL